MARRRTAYDGAHIWNTEWPRIREIGENDLLMTMHGAFWKFPKTFSAANTAGIVPRSSYLKVIGDFCRWTERGSASPRRRTAHTSPRCFICAATMTAPRKRRPFSDGVGTGETTRGVLHARGEGLKTLRFIHNGAPYDLDGELRLRKVDDTAGAEWTAKNVAIPHTTLSAVAASAFWTDAQGARWRLPPGTATDGARVAREICTERNLLNAFGTFYEFPAENAGGFPKIRPIATHDRAIWDYASYRGLLVISGIATGATGEHKLPDAFGAYWLRVTADTDTKATATFRYE